MAEEKAEKSLPDFEDVPAHRDIPLKWKGEETIVRIKVLNFQEMCNLQDEILKITVNMKGVDGKIGGLGTRQFLAVKKCFMPCEQSLITWEILNRAPDIAYFILNHADKINKLFGQKKGSSSSGSTQPVSNEAK